MSYFNNLHEELYDGDKKPKRGRADRVSSMTLPDESYSESYSESYDTSNGRRRDRSGNSNNNNKRRQNSTSRNNRDIRNGTLRELEEDSEHFQDEPDNHPIRRRRSSSRPSQSSKGRRRSAEPGRRSTSRNQGNSNRRVSRSKSYEDDSEARGSSSAPSIPGEVSLRNTNGFSSNKDIDKHKHSQKMKNKKQKQERSTTPSSTGTLDIYEAYKRLSTLSKEELALHEEHNSASSTAQQTPLTSASTQINSEDDERSSGHQQHLSPSSSSQKQKLASQRTQRHTNNRNNNNKVQMDPSESGASQSPSQASGAISAGKKSNKTRRKSAQGEPGYQRQTTSGSSKRHPALEASGGKQKTTQQKLKYELQQDFQRQQKEQIIYHDNRADPVDHPYAPTQEKQSIPTHHQEEIVMQARQSSSHHQQEEGSDLERAPSRGPPADLSNGNNGASEGRHLRRTLYEGYITQSYAHMISDVKTSLENVIMDSSHHNAAAEGSSHQHHDNQHGGIKGAVRGLFGGRHQEPSERSLSESDRRARGNPFLNRPKGGVKKAKKIGNVENIEHAQEERDHRRRGRHDDDSSHGIGDSSHPRGTDGGDSILDCSITTQATVGETFIQKHCPMPKPIRMVQSFCGKIVTNTMFQIFMVVLIMFNAIILGIATYDFPNPEINDVLDWMDRVLLVIFTIELALQFGYCGITLFLDGWLVFDALTVVTSWWLDEVQVFRSFRIFRSFRLIVRLPILKNLVLTVFHVMPRVYSICGLLVLILYVYGVLCTVLFGEMYELGQLDQNYFGRLDYSAFTLFQMVTLEGWGDIVRQVAEHHRFYSSIIFSSFIIITGFIMYNLIVAVMCDSMLVIEAQGREEIRAEKLDRQRALEMDQLEEERKMEEEMLRQREECRGARLRAKGLIEDDPTIGGGSKDTESSESSELDSLGKMLTVKEEEEEEIEYMEHFCENCGVCTEMPVIPFHLRKKFRRREIIMEDNQERVHALKKKIEQLAETQQRVTAVLQTLMVELEASRQSGAKTAAVSSSSHNKMPRRESASVQDHSYSTLGSERIDTGNSKLNE